MVNILYPSSIIKNNIPMNTLRIYFIIFYVIYLIKVDYNSVISN